MSALSLFTPPRISRLIASDTRNVTRDPMLVIAAAMSLLPALSLAWFRSPMDEAALSTFGVADPSRYLVPVALMIPAALIGWVTGFLMLEDRDEGTLLAVDVTPVGKFGFLLYRVAMTALLSIVITLYAWPLILPGIPVGAVLLAILLVAMNTVGFAVVLPAVARNKVEGLAVTKITNLLALAPLLAAIPSPLRFIGALVPSFWIGEVLGVAESSAIPLTAAAAIGLTVNVLALAALSLLFIRRSG